MEIYKQIYKQIITTIRTNFSCENLTAIKQVYELCDGLAIAIGDGNVLVNPDTGECISYHDIQQMRGVLEGLFSRDCYLWKVSEE